jgi:hypothetical protein
MNLHVELDGDEIVVTRSGTDFLLAYRKRPDSPNLVLRPPGIVSLLKRGGAIHLQ